MAPMHPRGENKAHLVSLRRAQVAPDASACRPLVRRCCCLVLATLTVSAARPVGHTLSACVQFVPLGHTVCAVLDLMRPF